MDTTINNAVQQILPHGNQAVNQKKTSEKTTSQSDRDKRPAETQAGKLNSGSEKTDTVEIANSRFLVSEANRAAAETEIEDIDQAVEKIQELKRWVEAEYESKQFEQAHRLNGENLVEILS